MDLKEFGVTVITCLQVEEWESNMQNLTEARKQEISFSHLLRHCICSNLEHSCIHATVRICEL